MSFDDATNMLTCAFSLDGGTTFQSPFPSMHIFNGGVVDYDILLGAAGTSPSAAARSTAARPAGGTIGPNDARTFKARNAPPPAGCNVAACSPSGAFLDQHLP